MAERLSPSPPASLPNWIQYLTWEGVGCDSRRRDWCLTGDQDHDETISPTFTTPGEYTLLVTTPIGTLRTAPKSEGYVLTVSEPVAGEPLTMKTESVLSGEPFTGKSLTLTPDLLRVVKSLTPRRTRGNQGLMAAGAPLMASLV